MSEQEKLALVAALLKKHRALRYGEQAIASDELIDKENAREIIAALTPHTGGEDLREADAKLLQVREFLLDEYKSAQAEAEGFPVDKECRPAWDALHDALSTVHTLARPSEPSTSPVPAGVVEAAFDAFLAGWAGARGMGCIADSQHPTDYHDAHRRAQNYAASLAGADSSAEPSSQEGDA